MLRCCAGHEGSDPHLLEMGVTPLTHTAPTSGNTARITHFGTRLLAKHGIHPQIARELATIQRVSSAAYFGPITRC